MYYITLGLIPPHPGYGYDHLKGLISSVCGGCQYEDAPQRLSILCHWSSTLEASIRLYAWLTQWTQNPA